MGGLGHHAVSVDIGVRGRLHGEDSDVAQDILDGLCMPVGLGDLFGYIVGGDRERGAQEFHECVSRFAGLGGGFLVRSQPVGRRKYGGGGLGRVNGGGVRMRRMGLGCEGIFMREVGSCEVWVAGGFLFGEGKLG